jgi:K+-transporting ATPase ATPase C chain
MLKLALRAFLATIVLAVITGLVYPLTVTAVAQLAMASKADGSLVTHDGATVGSSMIGQSWTGPEWFHGRPSAVGYDAATSGGSNLGPTSEELSTQIAARVADVLALEAPYTPGLTAADVPADLVTASASGLDPDISVAAARFQAPRIAAVHHLPLDRVQQLIDEHTQGRTFGLLGDPRVNVLELNLALAALIRG